MRAQSTRPWAEQSIEQFFQARACPTRGECDQYALSVAHASAVRPVHVPSPQNYTVVCTRSPNQAQQFEEDLVVSFRQPGCWIDENLVRLARAIHGSLVPQSTELGVMTGSVPPLRIYIMPFLRGTACLTALSSQALMDPGVEAKHLRFVKDLARYFSRCWLAPQYVDPRLREQCQSEFAERLAQLRDSAASAVPPATLSTLENIVPLLFSGNYPLVLTHGDLSQTNILLDPDTLEVTAIVGWSLAAVRPFGLELDTLFLLTGYMDVSGWHGYSCRSRLLEAFWDEFWIATGIEDGVSMQRKTIRRIAEAAGNIGAILRYGFAPTAYGSPIDSLRPPAANYILEMG